jgi:hypothetical protein
LRAGAALAGSMTVVGVVEISYQATAGAGPPLNRASDGLRDQSAGVAVT